MGALSRAFTEEDSTAQLDTEQNHSRIQVDDTVEICEISNRLPAVFFEFSWFLLSLDVFWALCDHSLVQPICSCMWLDRLCGWL